MDMPLWKINRMLHAFYFMEGRKVRWMREKAGNLNRFAETLQRFRRA